MSLILVYNVEDKHLQSSVLDRRVMHQQGEFARKWAHPFPGFSYSQKPSKCSKVLIRGVWGAPSHILQKTKNINKKTYKKTDAPPWAGISSMQSPTQPLGCIVGHYIAIDNAEKKKYTKKKGEKMSAQFIHIETYARHSKTWTGKDKAGKAKGGTTRSIQNIVDEAIRKPNNCPHIAEPIKPIILYGNSPEDIPTLCNYYATTVKTKSGQKLRPDALVCIAGVVSVGEPDRNKWEKVKHDSIKYLKDKYGERLKSVIEHKDEAFPHIHFYVIPKDGEKLEDIHEGLKARNKARDEKKPTGTQNRDYIAAMKTFQDDYNLAVGIPNGLTRIGPARRRLTREAWKAETTAANNMAEKLELYKDTKKMANAGYRKGLNQGLAEANDLGLKVGSFLKAIREPWNNTIADLSKQQEEIKKALEEEKKAREKAELETKKAQELTQIKVKETHQYYKGRLEEVGGENNEYVKKLRFKLKEANGEIEKLTKQVFVLTKKEPTIEAPEPVINSRFRPR